MKKSIFFLMVAAMVAVGFSACSKGGEKTHNTTPNSLQQEGLKGAVKSVDMRTYEVTTYFGDVKKGDLISTEDMSFNFPLYAGLRYDYNSDGNEVQVTMRNKEGQIDQMQKKEYFQNYLIGEKYYDNRGDLSYSWRYEIKNDKPVSQITTFYFPGVFESDQRSSMSDTLQCVFDGFLIKSTYKEEDGKIVLGSEYTYENGMLVSTVNYNSDNSIFRVDRKRNDAGLITRFSITNDEKEMVAEDLTYDERGFLTRYIFRGMELKENESIDYTMEYLSVDDHGNWTRRVVNKNQMPLYLQERTILYYDDQSEPKGRMERKEIKAQEKRAIDLPTSRPHQTDLIDIKVYIDAIGEISIATGNEEPQWISEESLKDILRQIQEYNSNVRVVLNADELVEYRKVASVTDIVNELHMALVVTTK